MRAVFVRRFVGTRIWTLCVFVALMYFLTSAITH
jgi:hypothetical protein